ncbi:hypothetical protein FEP51_06046 [Burkholderia multivorans]|nr:hypothetical protein [Burkholderia multivorans]
MEMCNDDHAIERYKEGFHHIWPDNAHYQSVIEFVLNW